MRRLNALVIMLLPVSLAWGETPSEAMDRLQEKANAIRSWERTTRSTSDSGGVETVTTSVERALRNDGVLKKITENEKVTSSRGSIVATLKHRICSDGKTQWKETLDSSGKPVEVEKSAAPKSFLENMRTSLSKFNITMKPNEELDGAEHTVMILDSKGIPVTMTVWFNNQTGLEVKKVVKDDTGTTTWVITSFKPNPDLRIEQFDYTPPPGVPVKDAGS